MCVYVILCFASYFLSLLEISSEIFRHISSDCSCCLHALWSSSERYLIRAIRFDALTLFGTFILNLAIGTFSNWIKLLMQSSATWTQDTIEQLHEEKGGWNTSCTWIYSTDGNQLIFDNISIAFCFSWSSKINVKIKTNISIKR